VSISNTLSNSNVIVIDMLLKYGNVSIFYVSIFDNMSIFDNVSIFDTLSNSNVLVIDTLLKYSNLTRHLNMVTCQFLKCQT
jgi:hypothetical protein